MRHRSKLRFDSNRRGRSYVPLVAALVLCGVGVAATVLLRSGASERTRPAAAPAERAADGAVALPVGGPVHALDGAPALASTEPGICYEHEVVEDHIETDNDLPYQESHGVSEGLLEAPLEGPTSNGTIGIGGRAGGGGAFHGRPGFGGKAAGPVQAAVHGARGHFDTESYDRIRDNEFRRTSDEDVSTFSIDVDTASYSNVRRFLMVDSCLPPPDAVRVEEMINYFPYAYAGPGEGDAIPFRTHTAVAACPWNPQHRLVRVAIKGREVQAQLRPAANLVFLIDASGSMNSPDKLPLLKAGLQALVRRIEDRDRVAIVVYAGAAGLVLPSTLGTERAQILSALEALHAGGSTNGASGIELAYRTATEQFIEGGINRVILATDGDFNVGVTDRGQLTRLIEQRAKTGVYLSVLGFGRGNLKDATMEELSNRGNGNYAYVDSMREAQKALVEQANGTLITIAKDVKIQVFFNPLTVAGWRLVGYENRLLAKQDFNDDAKDAGEIGAGHCVTALYEIVPAGTAMAPSKVDPNPFVKASVPGGDAAEPVAGPDETALLRLRLRYKQPDSDTSALLEQDVFDDLSEDAARDLDFEWAACVAAFGMCLRNSEHGGLLRHGGLTRFDAVLEMAGAALGDDPGGYRAEFLALVRAAKRLAALSGEGQDSAR